MPWSTRLPADRLTEATRRSLVDDGRPVGVRVVELHDLATDIAYPMVTGFPSSPLREVQEAVTEADGVIAVTPILTASCSGLFKSFFDVIDNDVLIGKPALIAATGGTARHSLALEHALRPPFGYPCGRSSCRPLCTQPPRTGTGTGNDTDDLAARISRAAGELAGLMAGHPPPHLPKPSSRSPGNWPRSGLREGARTPKRRRDSDAATHRPDRITTPKESTLRLPRWCTPCLEAARPVPSSAPSTRTARPSSGAARR